VLLYELLSGTKPFDSASLRQAAEQEMKRIIREVEPPRPSTRLSGMGEEATKIASDRREDLSALSRRLHSELEWIPLMAIRKERDRRYASPLQLSEDIQNYLEGKPLLAGPESRVYRTKKFLRRHTAGMAISVAMLILLTAGISFYIHSIRAEQRKTEAALQEAQEQTAIAEAVSQFQSDMLASADPDKLLGDKVTVLQAAQAAVKELDAGKLKDQPLVEAAVRSTIGNTLRALARYDAGKPNLQRALEMYRKALPAGHPSIASSLNNLARLLQAQGKLADAEPLYREALEMYRKTLPAGHPWIASSLNNLAQLLLDQGKLAEAEPLYREALEML
ncbi:MAG: tetratricopeptide repeat protein, partial [Terriglobales bacterium]